MAQVPVLIQGDASTIPYLATADKTAGDVVLLDTIPAIVKKDIDFSENPLGSVSIGAAGEIWMVPQKAEVIADGAAVYWDATGDPVGGTQGTGAATATATTSLMGTAAAVQMNGTTDTAATDGYVLVVPSPAKRTATLGGAVTADSLAIAGAGGITLSGTTGQPVIVLTDNLADALSIKDGGGGADLMVFKTTNGSEEVSVPTARFSAAGCVANTAGVGITGAADSYVTRVEKIGTIFKTTILVEIDGLNSGGTAGDIIGANGSGVAHLGQITAAVNGTIFAGKITCLETPAGGDPDVDLYSATEATGVEDTAISALTNTQLINHGDWTGAQMDVLTAFPAANKYLYLVAGDATDAAYTAGIFLIELYGK
jgi:hypothetical protein